MEFDSPIEEKKMGNRANRLLKGLKKEHFAVGKTRVKSWHAWLVIGFAVGITGGVFLVSSRGGDFGVSRAADTAQEVSEDFLAPAFRPFAEKNLPEQQAIRAQQKGVLVAIQKLDSPEGGERTARIADLRKRLGDRRTMLAALIQKDPDGAFTAMLPASVIAALPPELQSLAEKPVSLLGKLETIHVDVNLGKPSVSDLPRSEFRYYVNSGGTRYELHPVGSELNAASGATVRVSGYQLGAALLAPVGVNGIEITAQAPQPVAIGEQKTLAVLVNFQDSGPVPFTAAEAKKLILDDSVQAYYKEASYGQMGWSGDVVDWITLPRAGVINGSCLWPDPWNDGLGNLLASRYDLHQYGYITIFASHYCMGGGMSSVGASNQTFNGETYHLAESWVGANTALSADDIFPTIGWSYFDYVLAHEWGHALGVMHANSWECQDKILYGNCNHWEYGNLYDTMGSPGFSTHFNGFFKDAFGWLSGSMLTITKSGTYTINPLESSSGVRAAKIQPPGFASPQFYLEFRQPTGFDSVLSWPDLVNRWGTSIAYNGLFVNWNPTKPNEYPMTRLLDMTPHPTNEPSLISDWTNVVLARGMPAFRDKGSGITIGPVVSEDSGKITFRVRIGPPHCVKQELGISTFVFNGNGRGSNQNAQPINLAIDATAGDFVELNVSFQNRDSAICAPRQFQATVTPPQNWTALILNQNPITISPGDYAYQQIEFRVPADAAPGSYTAKATIKDTSAPRRVTGQEINLTVTVIAPPSIQVLSPNGGEQWQIGSVHTIQWTPYNPQMGINVVPTVSAYLEKLVDGNFITIGKIIESGKASIHWIGDLDSYGNYAEPGDYYVRVVNSETGQSDRSDGSFKLVPQNTVKADLKINGSDGPIVLPAGGGTVTFSWTSQNADACTLYLNGMADDVFNLLSSGQKSVFLKPNPYPAPLATGLVCESSIGSASDLVFISPAQGTSSIGSASNTPFISPSQGTSLIKVLSPNGGEKLNYSSPRTMNWSYSPDVYKFSVALYKNDAFFKWIAPNLPSSKGFLSWTPSRTMSSSNMSGEVFKIYLIGYKSKGGTVEDKSDAPFSIVR